VPDRELLEDRVVAVCARMYSRGLIVATEGNVSARVAAERILITPAGRGKGFLSPRDLVTVDGEGRKRAGRLEASTELPMHLALYRARPEIGAVVHGHPPTATGFAVAGIPLADCVLPEVIVTLGSVPIAGYAMPSSADLGESVAALARAGHDGMLLKNHGAVAIGRTVEEAFDRLETIEQFARIVFTARLLGRVETLAPADVARLLGLAQRPGEPGNPWRCGACRGCRGCDSVDAAASGAASGGPAQNPVSNRVAESAAAREHLVDRVADLVRRRLTE